MNQMLPVTLRMHPLSDPDGHDLARLRQRCTDPNDPDAAAQACRAFAEWAYAAIQAAGGYIGDAASATVMPFISGKATWLDTIERDRDSLMTNSEYVRLMRTTARWRQRDVTRGEQRRRRREFSASDDWIDRRNRVVVAGPDAAISSDASPRAFFSTLFAEADYQTRLELLGDLSLAPRAAEALVLYSLGTPTRDIADRLNMSPDATRKMLERARRQLQAAVSKLPSAVEANHDGPERYPRSSRPSEKHAVDSTSFPHDQVEPDLPEPAQFETFKFPAAPFSDEMARTAILWAVGEPTKRIAQRTGKTVKTVNRHIEEACARGARHRSHTKLVIRGIIAECGLSAEEATQYAYNILRGHVPPVVVRLAPGADPDRQGSPILLNVSPGAK